MLTRVYHHSLRDRPMRNVLPVPESSMDAQMRDCAGPADDAWEKFIPCVEPVRGPSEATPAQEIEEAVGVCVCVCVCVCDRAGAQLFLQGKGWERARRKLRGLNTYYHRYFPTVDGTKVLVPLYVNLRPHVRW